MDQLGRLGLERFGAGDQIGFVIGEEIEHGAQHGGIAQAGAQFLCAQPGQVEQAFGAARILQRPSQRAKSQSTCAVFGGHAVRGMAV